MDKTEKIDCTTCKYGYEDERLGIPMCHHPKRFLEDCVDFNMHEEKHIDGNPDKSLEEAAEEYRRESFKRSVIPQIDGPVGEYGGDIKSAFIAGWKCRDDQMPMPEDTVLFNKGVAEGRRLEREDMLGDAISCEIDWYDGPILNYPIDQLCEVLSKMDIDVGDKVRIIVCKKEEE